MKCLILVTLVSIFPLPSLSFWHLLLPSSVPAMTFLAPCLPVHMPGCWAGRAQPHPGCDLSGAPCPGSQIRVEEGLLGDSGKPLAFQVGELRPREGTGLTQGHTEGTSSSPSPNPPSVPLNGSKEMGIPNHLTCLLRNLYAGQEATVRTGCGTTDWFQIGKGVRQAVYCAYLTYMQSTS